MRFSRAAALAFVLAFVAQGSAPCAWADEVYKWTDSQGRVHYSNRSAGSPPDSGSSSSAPGGEGWESVLERQKGPEDLQQKADAAINGFELRVTRKKRDRSRAQDDLDATQAEITRATRENSESLPALKTREATQTAEVRKLDEELGALELQIVKLRALKAAGKDGNSH